MENANGAGEFLDTKGPRTGDDPDTTMEDAEYEPDHDAEYQMLDELECLYHYAIPKQEKGTTAEERTVFLREKIQAMIEKDFETYKIGEAPREIGADEKTEADKLTKRHAWRREKLLDAKRKVLFAYGLEESDQAKEGQALKDVVLSLEETEVEYEIEREPGMSDDKEWAKLKAKRIQEKVPDSNQDKTLRRKKEKEEEEDAEDEKKRNAMQEAALHAADRNGTWEATETKIIDLRTTGRSDEILALQIIMASLVLHWWENKPTSHDIDNCTAINAQLARLPGGKNWQMVPTEIEHWQTNVRTSLMEYERTDSDKDCFNLASSSVAFTNRLRKAGLDWKMVTSREMHRRIIKCLQGSLDSRVIGCTEELAKAYLTPRDEQLTILNQLLPVIVPVMFNGNNINADSLPICQTQLQHLNSKLGDKNLSIGLPKMDHTIPTVELEDAIKNLREGRQSEADAAMAKMLYKIKLLGIPGFKPMSDNAPRQDVDTRQTLNECLDICRAKGISGLVEDVPLLENSRRRCTYQGLKARTVGWGDSRGRFYINEYGTGEAVVFRKEKDMSVEWMKKYPSDNLPLQYKVSISANRLGDEKDRYSSKKVYGKSHLQHVLAVAFTEGPDPDYPLELIDPETYDDEYEGKSRKWGSDYVLIGWVLDGIGLNVERRWEPRAAVRERYGRKEADQWIYNTALKCQRKFDTARGLQLASGSIPPEALDTDAMNRHRGAPEVVIPPTISADPPSNMFVYPSVETTNEDRLPRGAGQRTVPIQTPVTGSLAAMTGIELLGKCRAASLSASDTAAVMFQRFGADWPLHILQ
jgi:hypothetical protein